MKHLVVLGLGAATLIAADFAAEGDRWWAHIAFLADDKLQGREVGSDGYQEAAQYVAGKMETFGLKPAGTSGYFQPVKFETRQLVEDESSLTLVRDGGEESAGSPGRHAEHPRGPGTVAGGGHGVRGLWPAGAGSEVRRSGRARSARQDRGVCEQHRRAGRARTGEIARRVGGGAVEGALQAAGAIGTATIMNPRPSRWRWRRSRRDCRYSGGRARAGGGRRGGGGRGPQKAFLLADPELQESTGQKVALTITRRGGEKFFAGSGYTMDDILKLATDNKPLPKFPLVGTLRTKAAVKRETVEAPNVAGMLPGSDPKLKNEYVIMSAHLDHRRRGPRDQRRQHL